MAPYALHARVYNLASTVSVAELERFLEEQFPGTNPAVRRLIVDDTNSKSGTVSLEFTSKNAARKALATFDSGEHVLVDGVGCASRVGIDALCEDLITLRMDRGDVDFE